jgi:tellurite resistance protein
MADSQLLTVIRIWAAMAWADGVIAEAEASALRRLIDNARLQGDDLATAQGYLESKTDLDEGGLEEMSADAKAGVYRAACRMAALDREVAPSERALLVKLRDTLGLTLDSAREIEAGIPGITVS